LIAVSIEDLILKIVRSYNLLLRVRTHTHAHSLRSNLLTVHLLQDPNWTHFARVHELTENLGVNAVGFVRAQFDEWRSRRPPYPQPNQLYCANAQERYRRWCRKNGNFALDIQQASLNNALSAHTQEDVLDETLQTRMKMYGCVAKEIFDVFPTDFPSWFQESRINEV